MMRTPLLLSTLALSLAACSVPVSTPTPAAPMGTAPMGTVAYGLGTDGQLVTFGLGNAADSAASKPIIGLGSDTLVDLDVNPFNGTLYAFASSGKAYTLDPQTGAATLNATAASSLAISKTDFNPAANRVRVFASAATNFRLSVTPAPAAAPVGTVTTDGLLVYAAGDVNAGKTPNLLGAAYTNSALNSGVLPASTALFSVDGATNTLNAHSSATGSTPVGNFSTLATVGSLGVTLGSNVGFDITTSGSANTAYLVNDKALYTVSLTSGAATPLATLGTSLKALAVTQTAQ
jgi:Domain of unknown function (DUF4394)